MDDPLQISSPEAAPTAGKHVHDFRNQIAIIQGYAEVLISETATDDPRRQDLDEIHKAAATALALLTRLFPDLASPR